VKGADRESPAERPVLTVPQVFALADAMRHRRFRVPIRLTAFATLRWGEVTALRRRDVAPDGSWVRVNFAHTEVPGRLLTYVDAAPDALIFTGPKGAPLRRGNFNTLVRWIETVGKLGMQGLHFHDLRHTGNLLAAQSGVSTKDLMARMGHDDMRAALIYQRATIKADQQIAERLVDDHWDSTGGDEENDGDGPAAAPVQVG
jgi:integrase